MRPPASSRPPMESPPPPPPPRRRKASVMTSVLSLSCMVVLLSILVAWDRSTTTVAVPSSSDRRHGRRLTKKVDPTFLVSSIPTTTSNNNNNNNNNNDDATHSATCKKYLLNFLNGTTDLNDECDAFKAAFHAADCQEEGDVLGTKGETAASLAGGNNNTKTDNKDDVLIDDFFENWECCDSIQQMYSRNCEEEPGEYHSVRLLAIVLVLLVCTLLKACLKRAHIGWLPDACAFILVGTLVGGVLRLFDSSFVGKRLSFDNDLFLQILLPPIIFQAALSIDKRAFRRDLFPILAFAGFGTAFSAIAIGWITHKVSQWGSSQNGHLPLLDSLVFGSLIASIDPVATLSILSSAGVSQTDTLYTLIFGESLLNDGVAIVLFDTLKSHLGGQSADVELDQAAYHHMANHFAAVLFGSIAIGVAVGFTGTLYFYFLRGQQTAVTEVAVFFCWALVPYYIAEAVGWSGIIAIMVMGFFMDYFVVGGGFESEQRMWTDYMALRNHPPPSSDGIVDGVTDPWTEMQTTLSKAFGGGGHILSESRHHVGFVAHVIANLMETAIFAYLGLFLFSDNVWNLSLNLTAILSCVSSRALMVVSLSFLINAAVFFDLENQLFKCVRGIRNPSPPPPPSHHHHHPPLPVEDEDTVGSHHTRIYLDRNTQLILLLSGVRGAVSFTLVESIPVWDAVTKVGSQYKAELKAMTSTSIVFTLFVFGALTYITVKQQGNPSSNHHHNHHHSNHPHHPNSFLTHRLMSDDPLDSEEEDNRSSQQQYHPATGFSHSTSLEIDHPSLQGGSTTATRPLLPSTQGGGGGLPPEPYRAPTNQWHE